eukprot:4343989-Pleurochrysis_carterae.AAC.1
MSLYADHAYRVLALRARRVPVYLVRRRKLALNYSKVFLSTNINQLLEIISRSHHSAAYLLSTTSSKRGSMPPCRSIFMLFVLAYYLGRAVPAALVSGNERRVTGYPRRRSALPPFAGAAAALQF